MKIELQVVKGLGLNGEFLMPPLREQVDGSIPTRRFYTLLEQMEADGLLTRNALKLRIPGELSRRIGSSVIALTEKGKTLYRSQFGAEPLDRLTPFARRYHTVEAGVFLQLVTSIIAEWNTCPDRTWDSELIDTASASPEDWQRIPGARRSYYALDGSSRAMPDLILQMRHGTSGESILAVADVTRGKWKPQDLLAKCRRAIRCYPPRQIYVIVPNGSTRDKIFQAWEEALPQVLEESALPHGLQVVFYTAAELDHTGLRTARELAELAARENGGSGKTPARFPRFLFVEPDAAAQSAFLLDD